MTRLRGANAAGLTAAIVTLALITLAFRAWLSLTNPTSAALAYLLVVLVTATASTLPVAIAAAVLADVCLNYFFMPPFGTLSIADSQNWVALCAFLAVSVVASNLSSAARGRAREATARRDELARLFDLSRDVLLITDTTGSTAALVRAVASRFDLEYAAICLPRGDAWRISASGTLDAPLDPADLSAAFARASSTLEFDAGSRAYAGHAVVRAAAATVHLVPLRVGMKAVGLLAAAGRPIEAGTLDALGGVAAIAIERAQLIEGREAAEVARKSEELRSALLASLGHDLRTPLTAIRVAATNLQAAWLDAPSRREQSDLILAEVERLTRLFQNLLEMARIDAGAVTADPQWVHPAQVVEAARGQIAYTLGGRRLVVTGDTHALVRLDPRVTAAAVAHLVENAAQYSAPDAPIEIGANVDADGLRIVVRDHGPGIAAADLPRLFDRFYRGVASTGRVSGTGMGLAIVRGLLAAERGTVHVENCDDGGARFTIVLPAEQRLIEQTV